MVTAMSDSVYDPFSWMTAWWMDVVLLAIGAYFAWEVLITDYPWAVLAYPGLLLFFAIWHIIARLFRLPKGPWLANTFPLLAFSVGASAVLFALSTRDGEYLRPAYFSVVWVVLMIIGSLLHLVPKREEVSEERG